MYPNWLELNIVLTLFAFVSFDYRVDFNVPLKGKDITNNQR